MLLKYEDGVSGLKGCPLRCSPENAHGEFNVEVDVCENVCILLEKSLIHEMKISVSAYESHIASESAFVFTLRFPALERSRQILPLRVGACRG